MNPHTQRFNMHNKNQQLIIAGMAGMITDEGLTFHEMIEVVEAIKNQTYPAMMELSREVKAKKGV